jgi:hypothetical protein
MLCLEGPASARRTAWPARQSSAAFPAWPRRAARGVRSSRHADAPPPSPSRASAEWSRSHGREQGKAGARSAGGCGDAPRTPWTPVRVVRRNRFSGLGVLRANAQPCPPGPRRISEDPMTPTFHVASSPPWRRALVGLVCMAVLALALPGAAVAATGAAATESDEPPTVVVTDCPVFSGYDPKCTTAPPPGGELVSCLDPRLPCGGGWEGGGSGGGGSVASPTLELRICSFYVTLPGPPHGVRPSAPTVTVPPCSFLIVRSAARTTANSVPAGEEPCEEGDLVDVESRSSASPAVATLNRP